MPLPATVGALRTGLWLRPACVPKPGVTSFGSIYVGVLMRPRRTFDALVRDDRKVRFGAYGIAIAAALYGAVYFFLAHNGGRPTVLVPWLAIPAEEYYRWNLYMNAPSTVLAWVAAAGFAHLAARALGGRGDYESVLGTLGLAVSVAMWSTGLHDVVTTCMGYVGALDQRAYEDAMNDGSTGPGALIRALMLLYVGAFAVLFTKAIGASHGLSVVRSSCAGVLGFVVFQGLYFLFNR